MRNYSILFSTIVSIFFLSSVQNQCAAIDDEDEEEHRWWWWWGCAERLQFFTLLSFLHMCTHVWIAYWYQERIVFIIIHYYGKSRFSIFYINHLWCIMQLIISNAECARSVQYGTVWYEKNNVMSFFFSLFSFPISPQSKQ